jgi:AraC family transcriptional regulator
MIGEPIPAVGYLAALAAALVARLAVATAGEGSRKRRDLIAPASLARVLRHVEDRLAEPIEVADLAGVAGLSQAHFARVFARATGDTPHRFVMKRRVCRARDLLSAGEATLAEVAVRSGFGNQSHMSTAFAREVGLSPARYRAAFRAEGTD